MTTRRIRGARKGAGWISGVRLEPEAPAVRWRPIARTRPRGWSWFHGDSCGWAQRNRNYRLEPEAPAATTTVVTLPSFSSIEFPCALRAATASFDTSKPRLSRQGDAQHDCRAAQGRAGFQVCARPRGSDGKRIARAGAEKPRTNVSAETITEGGTRRRTCFRRLRL